MSDDIQTLIDLGDPELIASYIKSLQDLSVTTILIDVVPGPDGMGEEVYAKSIEDVVNTLSELGRRAEDAELENYSLREQVSQLKRWQTLVRDSSMLLHLKEKAEAENAELRRQLAFKPDYRI